MKSLLTVTLTARQVREACAEWAEARTGVTEECTIAVLGVEHETSVTVEFRKKRNKPRGNGHAVGELSEQERRLAG